MRRLIQSWPAATVARGLHPPYANIATAAMSRSYPLLGIRRQNVWANTVFVTAFVVLVFAAGGPAGMLGPWIKSVDDAGATLGEIEVLGEREILSYGSTPGSASDHLLFGLEVEPEAESSAAAAPPLELGGSWSYSGAGSDCRKNPHLSIRLRLNEDAIFGYGLIAPTACGDHAADELDYAVVQGRRTDGLIVFTVIEKSDGHALYRFEGALSADGLVGRLAASGGDPTGGDVVFQPTTDAAAHL